MTQNNGQTILQLLEGWEGNPTAEGTRQPEAMVHLRRLLAVPDDKLERLCALKRLALAQALHSRLGAASPLAELVERQLVQTIACESGLRGECETYAQVMRWRVEEEAFVAAETLVIPQF